MKKLNVINEMHFFYLKFFVKMIPHTQYKRIDFVSSNKSIMANKLLLTNLERFPRRIKSQLLRQ